jgi:hypothetical protein
MSLVKHFANSLNSRLLAIVGCALSIAMAVGCGEKVHIVPQTECEKNLSLVVRAYGEANGSLNHPPKNADELLPYLKPLGDPDRLLVSSSDGEPLVIIWGVDTSRGGPSPYPGLWSILVYERKGKGGSRVVADTRGFSKTIPSEDFTKLTFAGRHKPAAD